MTITICDHGQVVRTCGRCERGASLRRAAVCDHGQLARSSDLCERDVELARLQRIEAAAVAVLASGQAVYRGEIGQLGDAVHAGDLVPAAEMTALRAAVEGEVCHAE